LIKIVSMTLTFETFTLNSPDAVAAVDDKGLITFANARFCTLVKRAADRIAGTPLFDRPLPQPLKAELKQAITWAGKHEKEETFTCISHNRAAGEKFSCFCRVIPLNRGEDHCFLIEIRDETRLLTLRDDLQEKKVSHCRETLLKERRKRLFFGLFEELPTFIYLQRRDYTVAFANKKVRKLYGDAEGKLCYEVFAGRTSPCTVCPTFEVFDTGRSVEWEFTDNNGRTFLIYDYPFEGEDGEPLVLEMGVDITDLKTVEKALFQARKLQAIGVLAGGIAHDLNNNLVPIIFNVEFARAKVDHPDLKEALEEALQAANRAESLVAQVLEYSRQQDVNRRLLHISPLVRACIKDFQAGLPDNICLAADLNARSSRVLANETQMQQVVMNLMRNAAQAMPGGGAIHVSITLKQVSSRPGHPAQKPAPGTYVVLAVRDTGKGIRPDVLERIFDPFFTTKKKQGGVGMGLAVVHSIVLGNKGEIFVDSIRGRGTVFTVYLPLAKGPQAALEGELADLRGENIRLLLVDDDPGALSAMARALGQADFIVDTAPSGESGLAKFREGPGRYGLVLTDHAMPGMTGLEMARQMLVRKRDAKIVFCTGHIEPALEEQAKKEGVAGFARKPLSPAKLTELVRHHCR